MKKRSTIFISSCMLLSLVGMQANAADMIRIGSPYATTTLDPMKSAASGNIEAFGQLYSRLLRRDANGELTPGLASEWTMSDDGLVLTFQLRDAKFSDGTNITAEDVAFSITRVITEKDSAYAATLQPIESITAVGDRTVSVKLKHKFAPILGNLEVFNAGIVSKADVEKRGDKAFSEKPVTSGPYMVSEWRPNDRLILASNPNYWREGYPKNDGVEMIEVTNQNTRVSMLMAGELDAIRDVPWSQLGSLQTRDNLTVSLEPSTVIYMTLLNEGKAPFDDIKVREAAAHALNVPAITKAMTSGNAKAANSTLPSALEFFADDMPGISYDQALGKKLLSESKYNGEEVTLLISSTVDSDKLAALIQAQWAAIGLKSKIEKVDRGVWWERVPRGEYDAAPSWWYNETTDPDLAVRWALCGTCGNKSFYTQYNNAEVNDLTEQAAQELDKDKRKALYRKIQEITTEQVSQIPLYYPPYANAYSKKISGLKLSPMLQWSLEDTVLSK